MTTEPPSSTQETIRPEDVGLPPGSPLPFGFRPGEIWSPLLVSFPHVGLTWPADLEPRPPADFARNADLEVQRVYAGAEAAGAATIHATYSRLVVDLNRAADDVSSLLVPDHPAPRPRRRPGSPVAAPDEDHGHRLDRPGRGVVWASAVGTGREGPLRILERPLTYAEFEQRIARYHAPYYRAIALLLERRRARFGYAILLDAHSMPSSVGVDLVLGTLDGLSCAPSIESLALKALAEGDLELSVRLNQPYRGGEVVRRFGRPTEGLHALQLEIRRGLYMDEQTCTVWESSPGNLTRRGEAEVHGQHGHDGQRRRGTDWRVARATGEANPEPSLSPIHAIRPPPGTAIRTGAPSAEAFKQPVLRAAPPTPQAALTLDELHRRVQCLIGRLACDSGPLGRSPDPPDSPAGARREA